MDLAAHALWSAAAVVIANRKFRAAIDWRWTALWGVFPDLIGFGPPVLVGLWLQATGSRSVPLHEGPILPHAHLDLPLYPAAHSLVTFLVGFAIVSLAARRIILPMFGWMLHIVLDVPTHGLSSNATRFLWPLSDLRVDGIAWWTPWFWAGTYAVLAAVCCALWQTRSANPKHP